MSKWLRVWVAVAVFGTGVAEARDPSAAGTVVEDSADMLLIGIPALAFGLTWILDKQNDEAEAGKASFTNSGFWRMNGSPRHDLGLAMARSLGVTYGLKFAVDSERPNGKEGSFPSAHTAMTFTGAEFIRTHYGWGWGGPAYAAAAYVGWSRMQTDHHYGRDVLAGALIGILSNHDLSLGAFKFKPVFLRDGGDSPYRNMIQSEEPLGGAPGLGLEFRF